MVLLLYGWIFLYLLLATGVGYGLYWSGKKLLEHRRQLNYDQLKGIRNAHLLKMKMEEVCVFCNEPVDPEQDAYEPKFGWHHGRCYVKLLND